MYLVCFGRSQIHGQTQPHYASQYRHRFLFILEDNRYRYLGKTAETVQ